MRQRVIQALPGQPNDLSLTQSAISKQVAQLEAALQHKLFYRFRRSLLLTPEGAIFLSDVRKVLTQLEMTIQAIMTYRGNSEVLKNRHAPKIWQSLACR